MSEKPFCLIRSGTSHYSTVTMIAVLTRARNGPPSPVAMINLVLDPGSRQSTAQLFGQDNRPVTARSTTESDRTNLASLNLRHQAIENLLSLWYPQDFFDYRLVESAQLP
jgi:hypothetical protein